MFLLPQYNIIGTGNYALRGIDVGGSRIVAVSQSVESF
jgi:hypothetical protein